MKIARIATADGLQWVVEHDGALLVLKNGPFADEMKPGPEAAGLDEARFHAPAIPTKIVCVGRNYAAHAAEHAAEVPTEPLLFLKPPSSILDPNDPRALSLPTTEHVRSLNLATTVGIVLYEHQRQCQLSG